MTPSHPSGNAVSALEAILDLSRANTGWFPPAAFACLVLLAFCVAWFGLATERGNLSRKALTTGAVVSCLSIVAGAWFVAAAVEKQTREEAWLSVERAVLCPVAFEGIRQGEIKVLRNRDADKLVRECGRDGFVVASNAPGSTLRLASR